MKWITSSLLILTLMACSFHTQPVLPHHPHIAQLKISQHNSQGLLPSRPASATEILQWQAWLQQYSSQFRQRGWLEIKVSELPLWCIQITTQVQQTLALCRYAGAYGQLGKIEYGMNGILDHATAVQAADYLIQTSGEHHE